VFGFAEHALFTWIATLALAMTIVFNGGNINSLQLTLPALRAPLHRRGICADRNEKKIPLRGRGGGVSRRGGFSPPVEGADREAVGRVITPDLHRGLCRFRKEEKPETLLSKGTEQRPAEGGVVLDVERAEARTVVRALRRGTVVEVEHPRGRRDTTHFPAI